jgi:CheY-like chemotaxis protein
MANLLLVDDNESLRQAYSSFLTAEGHAVATASTVAEALEYLAKNTPDLLLIDMLMPKVNGIQLLQQYDIVNTHRNRQGDRVFQPYRADELSNRPVSWVFRST